MTINIGLIGCGMAAQTFHLPLIRHCPALQLTAIASSKDKSQMPDGAAHYITADSLIAADGIDAVVITTPNHLHYPLALAALEAGKHVVLEKPITLTAYEAQSLINAAKINGKLLSAFHNRRLDGDYLTLRRLVSEKRAGTVHRLTSCWDRYRPAICDRWRERAGAGSGIWWDLAPHLLDQAVHLFGIPEAITAHIRPLRPQSETADYAHALLHYPDKEIILSTSPYCSAPNPRYRLEGNLGTYVKYGLDPQEQHLKDAIPLDSPNFGIDPENDGIFYDADGAAHRIPTLRGRFTDYYENFALAVNGSANLLIPAEDAMQTIALIETAIQSSELKRTMPVLPLQL